MRFAALLTIAALGFWAAPAAADVTGVQSTFTFSGVCSDCQGNAGGELVLQDYTPGQTITSSNFVSFTYDGTNLLPAFTITNSQAPGLSGSMTGPFPSAEDFFVISNGEIFSSTTGGFWCAGESCLADYGNTNSWSFTSTSTAPTTVPEPFGMSLLAAPLLGLAALRRR